MNYFDYFLKNKKELNKKFISVFEELDKDVNEYYCGKPILFLMKD